MEQITLIASQRRNLGELKLKSGIEEIASFNGVQIDEKFWSQGNWLFFHCEGLSCNSAPSRFRYDPLPLQRLLDRKVGKMHTDQGSQNRCKLFHDAEIKISMDGRGRYLDNIFIERLEMVQMMRKRQGRFPYNSAHHLLSSLTLW